jgi:hypothetical protein
MSIARARFSLVQVQLDAREAGKASLLAKHAENELAQCAYVAEGHKEWTETFNALLVRPPYLRHDFLCIRTLKVCKGHHLVALGTRRRRTSGRGWGQCELRQFIHNPEALLEACRPYVVYCVATDKSCGDAG